VHGVQAAEDAIMAEMAEVKAGMERRHKREKRKKLEQKKKARVRAAQAVLGGSPTHAHLAPFCHLKLCSGVCVCLAATSLPAALHRNLNVRAAGTHKPMLKLLLPAQLTLLAGTTAESKTVSESSSIMIIIIIIIIVIIIIVILLLLSILLTSMHV